MIRKLVVIATSALLLTGCGENPQPTKRDLPEEPSATSPDGCTADPHAGMSSPRGGMPMAMPRPSATGPEVHLGAMVLTAPDGWTRKQPKSRITLAEFSLPRAEGDTADGRLTVTQVGGSVEANVAYWKNQFGGEPTEESQETVDIAGTQVVLVNLVGTYKETHQMQTSGAEHPGHRVRAAILKVGGRQFVVKCAGPEKTVGEHEEEFMTFVNSLKAVKPGALKAAKPGALKAVKPVAAKEEPAKPDVKPAADKPEATEPEATKPKSTAEESPQSESSDPQSSEPSASEPVPDDAKSSAPESPQSESTEPKPPQSEPSEPESTDSAE